MMRSLLTTALLSVAALCSGCPHDLTRRAWPDQQAPPDRGADLARDQAAGDLGRDQGADQSPPDASPDKGCGPFCVSTLAGKGTPGGNAGAVSLAQAEFTAPRDVTVDKWGTVYVADTGNHVIRQIANGKVTVLAGAINKPDFVDGPAAKARFYTPAGIDVDANGVIYVADMHNNRIRKISKGVVSTVAGKDKSAYVDGHVNVAHFYYPGGVAVDSTGNKIFVADTKNNRVRIIEGVLVATFAGSSSSCGQKDGPALTAQLCQPYDLVAVKDRVYVVEGGDRVRLIEKGTVSTLAGGSLSGFADGTGATARFNDPYGVAVSSSGDLLVADRNNHAIRKVSPAGVVDTIAGTGWGGFSNGPGPSARFTMPTGLAVDSKGVIYVADSQNHLIRVIQ